MSSADASQMNRIVRLIGVYDADHTVRGELAYWVGARLGRRHCALCAITHGSVRRRPEWKACQAEMSIPFDTYHRDDQPQVVRDAAGGRVPVVVAETGRGYLPLLSAEELTACGGSVDRMVDAIEDAASRFRLTLTVR